MRYARWIKSTIVRSVALAGTLALLTSAMVAFATSDGNATPALAKGKPCGSCHSGSPPSKKNAPH